MFAVDLQKLSSELSEHQRLLRSVQRQGSGLQLLGADAKPPTEATADEQERMIANQWTDLARQARDRNDQLQQAIEMAKTKVRKGYEDQAESWPMLSAELGCQLLPFRLREKHVHQNDNSCSVNLCSTTLAVSSCLPPATMPQKSSEKHIRMAIHAVSMFGAVCCCLVRVTLTIAVEID